MGDGYAWTRTLIVAGGLVATAAGGLALRAADERAGTAHMPRAEVLAARPELAASINEAYRTLRDPFADARAVSFDSGATTIGQRHPGQGGGVMDNAPTDRRFVIKRILPIAGPIKYGAWHWDEEGVPAGPLVITVDLDARVLSVFRNGYEIGATAVLLGTQEKPTPLGVFPILMKDKDHTSSLYDAPMPYTMRLTGDGVSIHATKVQNGFASHGCIGVPLDFAQKVFGEAHVGDKVYITRGKQVGVGDSLVD
ncbi:L,D-transpeptidase family protein [Novosphingobium sp. UBA1939]|uniref:L,D-transpeptidase family protein n=1 Tax=Novosphingobium sp. UBA1939 TaxID=1946982 RepID=UPI0025CEC844|nr:L,D-transpeptidase family protein [Novosphingobium sp. UBA1939]